MSTQVSLDDPTVEGIQLCLSEVWVASTYSLDGAFYEEVARQLAATEWQIGGDIARADYVQNRRDAERRLHAIAQGARKVSERLKPYGDTTHLLAHEFSMIAHKAYEDEDQTTRPWQRTQAKKRRMRHQTHRVNPLRSIEVLQEELEWLAGAAEQAQASLADRPPEKSRGVRPDDERAVRRRRVRAVAIAFSYFLHRTGSIGEGVGEVSGREEYLEAVMALSNQLGLGEWQERYLDEELLADCVPPALR